MKLTVLLIPVAVWFLSSPAQAKSPILLINGITGAALNVRDERTNSFLGLTFPHACSTYGKFKRLWVDGKRLLFQQQCSIYELSMQYDGGDEFSDMPGVKIEVPDFGGTSSVESLDELGIVRYMASFVEYFVRLGYKRGISIRAAPYDWRLAADQLEARKYFDELKSLVEEMYTDNNEEKVTLVIHSMGGLVSLHFLTEYTGIDQAWKDKHIHAYVTLSGAWSGGVAALDSVISGKRIFGDFDALNEYIGNFLVPIARTVPSIPWLLPRESVFGEQVLVKVQDRTYTAADYKDLFNQIDYTIGYQIHQDLTRSTTQKYPAPNVPTYCYYGVGVPTPLKYEYDDLDDQPTNVENGDGDGTVNLISSKVCHQWADMESYSFQSKEFDRVGHIQMVSNRDVLSEVEKIVTTSQRQFNVKKFLDILIAKLLRDRLIT